MIVLPSVLMASRCEPQLNAALAHELAHVKRRDLWWNWLWMLAAALFFFHPLIWLAKREWSVAVEIATDELALSVSRLPAAAYAQTLVELAAQHAAAGYPIFAIAVTESYSQLSRRIVAMKAPQLSRPFQAIFMLTVLAIAVIGVVPWRLVAQETDRPRAADPAPPDSVQEEEADIAQALRYGLDDVVASPSNHDYLELTPEQRRRIADLHRSFASHIKTFTNTALGREPDSRIGEVFDLSNKLGPSSKAELTRQEKELEHQLRSELSLDQIELAEGIILRERLKRGGVRAIVESDDLRSVIELGLERPPSVIDSRLYDASQKANDQIRALRKGFQELHDEFMQGAREIHERAFDTVLDQLGDDGKKLRDILSPMTGQDSASLTTGMNDDYYTSLATQALAYQLADAIVSESNHKYLELTPEQRRRIKDLHDGYATHVNELLDASWGIEPGTHIDDSFPRPDQGPEFQAEKKRLEGQFESVLRSELEPFQIELAEDVVLRERFKRGGLRAIVASTDLPDVAKLKIKRAPFASRLKDAGAKANADILELRGKLQIAVDEFTKKAREIEEREIDAALKDLGSDGDKLRIIMAEAAGSE
jgi:vacuolar-type H+-ATPase subunit H